MVNYLDQFLTPVTDTLSKDQARKILEIRAGNDLFDRIEDLRERANQGNLSAEEDLEYKEFVEALDVLSILQAKARAILEDTAA